MFFNDIILLCWRWRLFKSSKIMFALYLVKSLFPYNLVLDFLLWCLPLNFKTFDRLWIISTVWNFDLLTWNKEQVLFFNFNALMHSSHISRFSDYLKRDSAFAWVWLLMYLNRTLYDGSKSLLIDRELLVTRILV